MLSNFTPATKPLVSIALACAGVCAANTVAAAGERNAWQQPFASDSIWNMPIGGDAIYVPANLPAVPGNFTWAPLPEIDAEKIVLRPLAPSTPVYYSSAGWSGADRCNATGTLLLSVPIPTDYVVKHNRVNSSATFLAADGRTLLQTQPFTRCSAGASATSYAVMPPVDLYGDGIRGAHGGSGLSAIGGSLRVGELRPGSSAPRHALKVDVFAREVLYRCQSYRDCYRWPAWNADTYAVGFYGNISSPNNGNAAMEMGALLAIPIYRNLGSLGLETEPARQLAWTLQNYGAYIVDDTYAPSFGISAEDGPDGSLRDQFKQDWGFDFEQRANSASAWVRDIKRLVQALSVVDNNGPTTIGGGGTPLQPLAPPL